MRNFTNTLLFEQSIDLVPSGTEIAAQITSIFTPNIKIIESDCGTLLGRTSPLGLDLLGQIELSTGFSIGISRISQMSTLGATSMSIRTANTCISRGGICIQCFRATFRLNSAPSLGDVISIPPEFIIQREHVSVVAGSTSCQLSYTPDQYDRIYIFTSGQLRHSPADFSITGNIVTFTSPIPADIISGVPQPTSTITAWYGVNTTVPFIHWLAGTYSGSLAGMMPIPHEPFPLKPSLYLAALPAYAVNTLTSNVVNSPITPTGILNYMSKISDPLEQATLVALLNSIYLV